MSDKTIIGVRYFNNRCPLKRYWVSVKNNNQCPLKQFWVSVLCDFMHGSLYETFSPEKAKKLWDRFEFIYTPKHGSWLNIAEIELGVLTAQCLNRRIDNIGTIEREALAWQKNRNNKGAKVNWQFTADDARIKLKRLYPTIDD